MMMTSTPSAATKATYNKEQLLHFYRAISSQIQEPPENLKQFPVILSTKLLQPVNETNLHLFDTDYNINPDTTFPPTSTRGRGRGGRGGSRRGGGIIGGTSGGASSRTGFSSSLSLNTNNLLGGTSNSTTSPVIGNNGTSSLLLGRGIGERRGVSRSSPNTNSPISRLPAWALDDEDFSATTPTDSSGLHLSSSTFGAAGGTTSLGDDEDTFGTTASPASGAFSLESMAAATMKMNETWKHQLSKNKVTSDISHLDEELEPSSQQGDDVDWDSQWYYMSEDNEMKGPYSLQKLKEWMELSYLQSDTIVKEDLDSSLTRTLGDVLNNVMPKSDETSDQKPVTTNTSGIMASESPLMSNLLMGSSSYGLSSVVSPTSPLLSGTSANTTSGGIGMVSSSFRTESSTTRLGLNEPSPFLSSGTSSLPMNTPLQGSLLTSLSGEKTLTPTTTQPPSLPITPTPTPTNLSQPFSHPWGFSQHQPPSMDPSTLSPMMHHPHHGYPFMSPGMVNLPPFNMPPFMHQQNAWGMPSNMLGLGGNIPQPGQMPVSVTDIENELLFVPQHPSVDSFQQATTVHSVAMGTDTAHHHDEQVEQQVLGTQTTVQSPQLGSSTQEDKSSHQQEEEEDESLAAAEDHAHSPQEEVSKEQQHEETPQEKTPKSKSSKKSAAASSGKKESKATTSTATTTEKQTKKQPELPSFKPEPVFKSVPPSEVVSFAEPQKKEEKGWGVTATATTGPVPTLKQIMEQQKKESNKLNKETQQKKKEAEQTKAVSANPWGVVNVGSVTTPSIKEIQEEEAKKKKQNAQKQAQNQASVLKKATGASAWGTTTHQFKAIPNDATTSSTTSSTPTFFGSSTPTRVETKTFQFQAIKPQPVTSTITTTTNSSNSPTEEEEEESPFWEYTAPAAATPAVVITNASDKKKKDKKKKTPSNEKPTSFASSVGTTTSTASSQQTSSMASTGSSEELSVSQEFKDWFKKGLKKLNKSVDPPSFMNLLLSLNSDKEIVDYMSEYIGNSSAVQKFAQEFLANKSFETLPSNNQGGKKKK